MRKHVLAYAKAKAQINCVIATQLISAISRYIVQSLVFLNPKCQASSHILKVVVQPGLCQNWPETTNTGFLSARLN